MADIDDFEDEEERKRRSAGGAPEFSHETIAADRWTAMYFGIPANCDAALLRHAHDAGMQCAEAVAGPPSPVPHPFAPETIGVDKTREENFEHAVRRLDELDSRLRPSLLDDEAERQVPEQQPAAEIAPQWREVENDWHMIVGNETVAVLMPNSDTNFPEYNWLSFIVTDDYPEHGWNNVDFDTLANGQHTLEQWWHHARQGEAYRPETHDKEPIAVEAANQNDREPMTVEAIDRDPWAAVDRDIPEDANRELLTLIATTAYELRGVERDWHKTAAPGELFDEAKERHKEALDALHMLEMREAAPELESADEISRPLGAAELAERVRRIIENPSLADAERDDRVLQVVEERREEESQAEPAKQDDAPQVDSSQEPETQSSADRDAAEVDYLFGRQEMTEARSAAYDRFTGQELSSRTGQSAGPAQEAGQSQSHSKGRLR